MKIHDTIKYILTALSCFTAGIILHGYMAPYTILTPKPGLVIEPQINEAEKIPVELNKISNGRVMFALVLGQSNAANYGETLYKAEHDVYNYYKGGLYRAADPLAGASGIRGSVWGILGDSLIEGGYYDKVVFVIAAVGSTTVECWSGGSCHPILEDVMKELKNRRIRLTHILWHQGEEDNRENTPADVYKLRLGKILETLREYGQNAPFFVSIASFNPMVRNNREGIGCEIRRAQKEFIRDNSSVYTGPDTDAIVSSYDRFDRIHFSESGMKKYSQLWIKAIVKPHK